MTQFLLRISTIAMSLATTVFALSAPAFAQSAKIYAAGSLRTVMQDLATQYAKEAPFEPQFLFGPSGKLRAQIEKGETMVLFASASPTDTLALVQAGKLRSHVLLPAIRCVSPRVLASRAPLRINWNLPVEMKASASAMAGARNLASPETGTMKYFPANAVGSIWSRCVVAKRCPRCALTAGSGVLASTKIWASD